MKQHEVSLETIAGGAAPERWDHELRKVLKNVMDPNTDPGAKRSITLTVEFQPSTSRTSMQATLQVKSKLAPTRAVQVPLHLGERGGQLVAIGYDPNQPSLFPQDQDPDVQAARANTHHSEEEE